MFLNPKSLVRLAAGGLLAATLAACASHPPPPPSSPIGPPSDREGPPSDRGEALPPSGPQGPMPGSTQDFVINIGDLMAQWTNDRWVSTLHRVVNPPPEEGGRDRRQSLAFFHQPDWDAEITVLPSCVAPGDTAHYAPVRSGPHLMSKFRATAH